MQKTAQHKASQDRGGVSSRSQGFAHPHRNVAALGVEPGMKVADFGAGSGAYVLAIAERLSGSGRVYAVDVQRDLLRRIKSEANARGHANVDIIWADVEVPGSTKLADASVDLVLISNLLFQVEEKARVLSEARRVVRSQGRVAVIDWTESFGGLGPHKNDVIPRSETKRLAEEAGLELVKEFEAGAHHYGLLYRAPRVGGAQRS